MINYIACIRRLSQLLRFEIEENTKTPYKTQAYHLLFEKNGKPWNTQFMTATLKLGAIEVWGQRVTARIYWQIAIGISEKHVKEVYTPLNRYGDYTNGDVNGTAFAWQSRHKLLERGVTYRIDGVSPHQLQPPLLRVYEVISIIWHMFIQQASKTQNNPTIAGLVGFGLG